MRFCAWGGLVARTIDLSGDLRFMDVQPSATFDLREAVAEALLYGPESDRRSDAPPVPVGYADWEAAGYWFAFQSARERRAAGIPRHWPPCPELRQYARGKARAYREIGAPCPKGLQWAING